MILDSCFLIDLQEGDDGAIAKLDALVTDGRRLSVAAVTVTEVLRGLERAQRDNFDKVIAEMDVVPYDRDSAERAGSLLRILDERGEPIGAVDAMVAATALERDGIVVTRNVSEFRRVDQLRVEPY